MQGWPWIALVMAVIAGLAALACGSLGWLAGDAVIHLVFAEHALSGHWFEFNAGMPSGGETSPLYMLFVMTLYAVFGPMTAPYALQLGCLAAWAALLLAVWRLARLFGADPRWALLLVAMAGLMPGSARNAVLGMENVYFATGLLWWLCIAVANRWFERTLSWRTEAGYGLLAGVLACLRPEGVVIVAVLMTARAWNLGFGKAWTRWIAAGAIAAALFGAQSYAYWILTGGQLPFAGGMARHSLSAAQGWEVAGLSVNVKILLRWMAYWPLGLLLAAACFQMTAKERIDGDIPPGPRRAAWAMIAVVAFSTLFFMTIFPSEHLARYTIYYWPLAILAGWVGAGPLLARLWRDGGWRRALVWGTVAMLFAVYAIEATIRESTLMLGHPLRDVSKAHQFRTSATDKLLADLDMPAATVKNPAVVGLVEVQRRYWWDERVQVASLDGIVDNRLRPFVHHGFYDHLGYAKAVGMTHIAAFPNLNRDPHDFSLADLEPLEAGESIVRDGLRLKKLARGALQITPD
jgi:hypothetical protein